MSADNTERNAKRDSFTIENNVLKGKVTRCKTEYTSVGKLLFDTFKSNPDCVGQVDAITENEDTFADITERAIKCALWMQKQGVVKGDIVVISSHNHCDCLIPCIAALYLGAICNPCIYEMNTFLARHFISLSEPKIIFANEQSAGVVLEAAKVEFFYTKVVTFGDYPGTTPFSEVLKGHSESAVANFRCTEINDPRHTALILFSSGTTGTPKGVELSHEAMLTILVKGNGVELNSQIPMWFSNIYWISGSTLSLTAFASCTRRIIPPSFDEKTACEIIEKYKITWLMLATNMANRLVRYQGLHNYDLSSLKCLFVGGAMLKQESHELLKKNLPDAFVIQAYGMTELGGLITSQVPGSSSGSCGLVNANCQIKIVDPETRKTLGPNQIGELCGKTMSIMTRYYRNPEATKAVFDEDGWLHSGDLAYYNEDGEVYIVDRLKEIIKYKGHQVAPAEIENLLQSHPAVLEVAVVGIPHPTDDEHPIAFVSKVPDRQVTAQELINKVSNTLMDHYKLRGGVKFLPSLPYTPSGKISRKDLREIAKTLAVY